MARYLILLLLLFLFGCQGSTSTPPNDPKALQREGERLRQEHHKEMHNK